MKEKRCVHIMTEDNEDVVAFGMVAFFFDLDRIINCTDDLEYRDYGGVYYEVKSGYLYHFVDIELAYLYHIYVKISTGTAPLSDSRQGESN